MYRIVPKRGYVEVQDEFGGFVLTADTAMEAEKEIDSMEREWELD